MQRHGYQKNTLEAENYQLKEFEGHLNNSGRGKGLAIFYKQGIQHIQDQNGENIDLSTVVTADLDIIAIYRGSEGCLKTLLKKLEDLINFSKTTVVIGDMNVCNSEKPNNLLKTYLEGKSFKLIVNKATHIGGGHLDQAYILNCGNYEATPDVEIVPKYYSDHDAICISWRKMKIDLLMANGDIEL